MMTQPIILNEIPFEIDVDRLMKELRIQKSRDLETDFRALCEEAYNHAHPKAMIRGAYIDEKGEDYVIIEGVKFKSRVLRINLEVAERVFLACATCGMELYEWGQSQTDIFLQFWADAIQDHALQQAIEYVRSYIEKTFNPGKLGVQNPGSLKNWSIKEQQKLFDLIGDSESSINVKLLDSNIMVPTHSVSGIIFPTEISFVNCLLCPRQNCPKRRAPFNRDLYKNHYELN
ncbi:MAG: vitamin B12 dependent methionine synthase [Desulfobacteraceae bacterium]|nr:vitamin B12 dependent methionine synthase [Desulfobacteraceae bacterium]MBC2756382.1 vitamin B12 dependent methionine synthase [Desulfobacteraceae bacterium]